MLPCPSVEQRHLGRGDDTLCECRAAAGGIGSDLDRGAGIEGKAQLVGITEQRLDPRVELSESSHDCKSCSSASARVPRNTAIRLGIGNLPWLLIELSPISMLKFGAN